MQAIVTPRLQLRELTLDDDALALALLNDPDFIRFVYDRGVRTLAAARAYLRDVPLASYASHGFGLWCVERRADGAALGMCGLIRREQMPDVDLGYVFLPAHRGQGYAAEAASACRDYARDVLGLSRLVAYIHPDNQASARVLQRIGMAHRGVIAFPGVVGDTVLYAWPQ